MSEKGIDFSNVLGQADDHLKTLLEAAKDIVPPKEIKTVAADAVKNITSISKVLGEKWLALDKWATEMKLAPFSINIVRDGMINESPIKGVNLAKAGQEMTLITKSGDLLSFRLINSTAMNSRDRNAMILTLHQLGGEDIKELMQVGSFSLEAATRIDKVRRTLEKNEDTAFWLPLKPASQDIDWGKEFAEEKLAVLFGDAEVRVMAGEGVRTRKSEVQKLIGLGEISSELLAYNLENALEKWARIITQPQD